MGRMKENPKYNVISCRVSDDTKRCITKALDPLGPKGKHSIQDFMHAAIEEKLISDRQARIDALVSPHR